MATPHPLIAQLAAERIRRKISVPTLARRLGYTSESIRNWEKGRHAPDLDRFEDLAAVLGLRIELVPADTDPAPSKEGTE